MYIYYIYIIYICIKSIYIHIHIYLYMYICGYSFHVMPLLGFLAAQAEAKRLAEAKPSLGFEFRCSGPCARKTPLV